MRERVIQPASIASVLLLCCAVTHAARADAPQVVELFPAHGATDVDPGITELRITFDQDMSTRGMSICGGGPTFPKTRSTNWTDRRTLVMRVTLQPDHEYAMSLNCPSSDKHFRTPDGEQLAQVPWSFTTASKAPKLSKADRRKMNRRSLKELMKALKDRYSYYDLRDVEWKALEKKHRKKIVSASSTRSWIKRVAKMLSAADDVHLWITYRGKTTGTHQRKTRPNWNLDGIRAELPGFTKRNACVYTARTDDGIGYILIATLSRERTEQLAQVQDFLGEYKNCKALILDLRPNSGGAEPLAVPIAAWFVDGKKTYAKHVTRDPDAEGGFSRPYERTLQGHEAPRRFTGPVAVLTGPGIMSSCEAFLLMMKQGRDVTLIGSRSYGSSGNPKSHVLKNGVEVFIPSWKAMLPDGTCFEGSGIEPDIEVKAKSSSFKKRDPVIKRALEVLREKTE